MAVRKEKIFISLFALPFLGVGVWMLFSISKTVVEWQAMKSWAPVQVYVSRGGTEYHSGDDSTTYEAYAEYTYTYDGATYTGTRVMIDGGADNVGGFQQDLGRRLEAAARSKEAIEGYVNPAKPWQSVINRDMRWGLAGFKAIFVVVFGGAGAALLGFGLFGKIEEKDMSLPQYKDAPWLANSDWQTNEIRSAAKAEMYLAWGFTVLWNAISMPIPFLLREEIAVKHNYPALIALLFPLIGIGLLAWAVRRTLEWRRFGQCVVALDPFPGSIGGQTGGMIELNHPYSESDRFMVSLTAIYSYETGSGDDRRQNEKPLWQDTAVAHTSPGLYGTRIIFSFDVPEGLPPSDAANRGRNYHLWRLNLTADLPGVDIDRSFDIPVYPTGQKSRRIDSHAVETARLATQELTETRARSRIHVRPGAEGQEMHYPFGRNAGAAFFGAIFGAVFMGAGGFVIWKAPWPVLSWPFGGLFFLIGALVFLSCFYMAVNSLTVFRNSDGAIVTVRRVFGIPVRVRRAYPQDIAGVSHKSHFSQGHGHKQEKHFTIYAHLGGRNKMVLGEGFIGEREAEAGTAFICGALGIEKKAA